MTEANNAVGILGTGSYLPANVITNEEIGARVPGVTPEWIVRKTLIRTRRYAAEDEATSDLAARAAANALDQAGLLPGQVDYLIVATSTGDSPQPPTACLVQQRLGASQAACFDINVVCAGFVYGLALARSLVASRPGTHVLVVAADVYSRILDFTDRSTAVLLGDGAGAAVVGSVAPPYGIVEVDLSTRGDAQDLIGVAAGGSRRPVSAETIAEGSHFFRMNGRGVRDFVMAEVPPTLAKLLARAGVTAEEVDHFVPHQANGVLLAELARRCGFDTERTHLTADRYGNVGSASVPVALDDASRAGRLRDGDLVLLAGFGGGMSIGGCLVRWSTSTKGVDR